MFRSFRGIITFKAGGDNCEAFVNALRASGVTALHVRSSGGNIFGEVHPRQYRALVLIAKNNAMSVEIIGRRGVIFAVLRYKKRYGIILGGVMALFLIVLLSNTVLSIEIDGNKTITGEQVLSLLNENGIAYGKFIPAFDLPEIERSITASVKQLSWVGIRHSGGRLIVEVDEVAPKPQIFSEHSPCNIVASRPAQLVRAQVYSGTLAAKIGDGVTKGQLLISGARTDPAGTSTALHAYGKVIGQYPERQTFSQALCEEIRAPSGERIKRHGLIFFGREIPLGLGGELSGEYDYEQSTAYFSFFSLQLPLGITHKTYSPFSLQRVEYTKETAEVALLQKISDFESSFFAAEKIISREILRNDTEEALSAEVIYLIEGDIGALQEILVKS